jgi:hypothetical protein
MKPKPLVTLNHFVVPVAKPREAMDASGRAWEMTATIERCILIDIWLRVDNE